MNKLGGLPRAVYINLPQSVARRTGMEAELERAGIEATRFPGVYGTERLDELFPNWRQTKLKSTEAGATASHLMIIKEFAESNDDVLLVFEDDVDLSTVDYWSFTWSEFYEKLPEQWDVIQLYRECIKDRYIGLPMRERYEGDMCAAAYMIRKEHAVRLVEKHFKGDVMHVPSEWVEDTVFKSGTSYSINLFSHRDVPSTIRELVPAFHEQNAARVKDDWVRYPQTLDQLYQYL